MKKKKKFLTGIVIISIIVAAAYFIHHKHFKKAPTEPYKTEAPQKRTISQEVNVSGALVIKESFEVGSLQPGIIKEVSVKANDRVKKGQLLCTIDTGKDDTELREAQAFFEKAEKEFEYQKHFYHRQQQLYQSGQLSKNAYQGYLRDYDKAFADVQATKATRDKRKMEYESIFVKSPTDGIVLAVEATKGMRTTDLTNVKLFDIAQDPKDMEAELEIDESDVGTIKPGMLVKITANSFPDRIIKAKINQVSFTPKASSDKRDETAVTSYKARVDINNADLSLRPGMVVNANIKIQKAKDALSLSGLAFQMDEATVQKAAQRLGYSIVKVPKETVKKMKALKENTVVKLVWVVHNKQFIQKAITIGITDNSYWQIIDGLTEADNVLLDIEEPEELSDMYKRAAGGAL